MVELIRKLYKVAGKEDSKINRMFLFEFLKSSFEGLLLGAVMFLLMRVFQNIFESRSIIKADVILVFGIALLSVSGKIFFGYMSDFNKYTASYNIGAENRLFIGDKLKNVNLGYLKSEKIGNISAGLTTVIGELETISINIITIFLVGIIQTVVMAVFMLIFDYVTGLIILFILFLGIISNIFFQKKADSLTEKLQTLKINLVAATIEYVKGISIIKSFGKGREVIKEIEKNISENCKGFIDVEKTLVPASIILLSISKIGICIIIFSSILRFCNGDILPYKAVVLIVASFVIFSGFEMAGSMQNIRGVAVQNLDKITQLRQISTIPEGRLEDVEAADIIVDKIEFSYGEKALFKELSLVIPKGKTTAIVGSSGSGKTTLCNLIARFFDVDDGQISIGEKNIKEFKYDNLLSNFTFVFQDVYLFEDTIRNNIKFGKIDASDEEMIAVSKKARCHDFIMSLEKGYDTLIKEGGSNLSGGEKQRISIARAMLKPSEIVILDEATSSIDPENEEELIMGLKNLLEGKSVVVIAHKLETVMEADKIVVLEKGKIESVGTHSELIESSEVYRRFICKRSGAANWEIKK